MLENSKNTSEVKPTSVISRIGESYGGLKAMVTAPLAVAACYSAFSGHAKAAEAPSSKPIISLTMENQTSPLAQSQWYDILAIIKKSNQYDRESSNNMPMSVRMVSKTAIQAGEIFPVKVTFQRVTRTVQYGNWKKPGPKYKTSTLAKNDSIQVKKPTVSYSSYDTTWVAEQLANGVAPENMVQAAKADPRPFDQTIDKKFEQGIKFPDFKLTERGESKRKSFTALLAAPAVCVAWNDSIRRSIFDPNSVPDSSGFGGEYKKYSTPEQAQRICPPLDLKVRWNASIGNKNTRKQALKKGKKLPLFHTYNTGGTVGRNGLNLKP